MITFGQQNYPSLKLGNTIATFAKYGCLSDVIIMGYDWLFGKNDTPYDIVPKLAYNANGELLWSSLKNIGLELKEQAWHVGYTPRNVIDKWWTNNDVCCALELNNGVHFVWQISRYYQGLGYRVFDPWLNKKVWQSKNITGCRIFGKI